MKKMIYLWEELNSTFWFIPVLIIILSIFLALGLIYIDGLVELPKKGFLNDLTVNSSNSARSILTTISGAMIGVAGTVFSITLVVLQLASSQFGPRLIKNFMHIRLNQFVLGSYISTYLYCLIVLNAVRDGNEYVFIPSISIMVAILIAVLNIVLLVIYIHQISVSIQVDHVISDISKYISNQIETMFPRKLGEANQEIEIDLDAHKESFKNSTDIKSLKSGYLQYVDNDSLLAILEKSHAFLELHFRPGGHIVKGNSIGTLYHNDVCSEEDIKKIALQFIIGDSRSNKQDLEFSILQMVEIASRSLSPGVNDPFTAVVCIDNLTDSLCTLTQSEFPSIYRYNDDEQLKIVAQKLDFEGVLDASFNQIRQYAQNNIAVIIRLLEALIKISGFTKDSVHKKAVSKHAKMVINTGKKHIEESNDLDDLLERAQQLI